MQHGHLQVFIILLLFVFNIIMFIDGSLKSSNDRQGDLSKARQYGWTETVNTFDGYAQCFDRLKQLQIIPL